MIDPALQVLIALAAWFAPVVLTVPVAEEQEEE